MPELLFLCHRPPFPPNKGEKIRAFHILQYLSEKFKIHLGCVVDDPGDLAHIPELQAYCASIGAFPIDKRRQKRRALLRARPGRPLMPDFYYDAALQDWTDATLRQNSIDAIYIFSVAMAPYVLPTPHPRKILDAVDVDSAKWAEYGRTASFPMKYVWRREARTLLAFERRAAAACAVTLFVSEPEAACFRALAPECAGKIAAIENGVDLDRFSPDVHSENPYDDEGPKLVFTGSMDYWPNADATIWFARVVFPYILARHPRARFVAIGPNPGADVLGLRSLAGVTVTGRVPDVRPYLAHAAAVVCPLRIARGIQNKVLEGMAMGRPVIATPGAFEGVHASPGRDLLVADGAENFASAVNQVLDDAHPDLATNARRAMQRHYAWRTTLSALDRYLV